MFPYQRIKVWARSQTLAAEVLELTKSTTSRQADVLLVQLWRASSSIASNIAEGAAYDSHAQFARYLTYALGSANETESQLALAVRAHLFDPRRGERLLRELDEIKRMLWTFRKRVETDPRRKKGGR